MNDNASTKGDLKSGQGRKTQQDQMQAPSQWAQIVSQVMEKVVSGTNMTTTINFDNLEIDVPRAQGPDGRNLGGATWKLNGRIVWTTEAHKAQSE